MKTRTLLPFAIVLALAVAAPAAHAEEEVHHG